MNDKKVIITPYLGFEGSSVPIGTTPQESAFMEKPIQVFPSMSPAMEVPQNQLRIAQRTTHCLLPSYRQMVGTTDPYRLIRRHKWSANLVHPPGHANGTAGTEHLQRRRARQTDVKDTRERVALGKVLKITSYYEERHF